MYASCAMLWASSAVNPLMGRAHRLHGVAQPLDKLSDLTAFVTPSDLESQEDQADDQRQAAKDDEPR